MAYLFDDDKSKLDFENTLQPILDELETNYQNNINSIYDACSYAGSTPSGKTPQHIAIAISGLTKYFWETKPLAFSMKVPSGALATKGFRYDLTNVVDIKLFCANSSTSTTVVYSFNGSGRSGTVAIGETVTLRPNSSDTSLTISGTESGKVIGGNLVFTYETAVLRGDSTVWPIA